MEALDSTTDSQTSGITAGLLDDLAATVQAMPAERRHDLRKILMNDISDKLKRAIHNDERTSYRLAIDAGVRQQVIDRFVTGERDIRLATAAKLAKALGLDLAAASRPKKRS